MYITLRYAVQVLIKLCIVVHGGVIILWCADGAALVFLELSHEGGANEGFSIWQYQSQATPPHVSYVVLPVLSGELDFLNRQTIYYRYGDNK